MTNITLPLQELLRVTQRCRQSLEQRPWGKQFVGDDGKGEGDD